jgi:hypothetical protein
MGAARAPATRAIAPDPATEDEGCDAGWPPGRTGAEHSVLQTPGAVRRMVAVASGQVQPPATGTDGGGAERAPDTVGGAARLASDPERGGGARLASSPEVGAAEPPNRSRSRTNWIHRGCHFFGKKGLQEGLFVNHETIVSPPLVVDPTAYAARLHPCTGCGVCTGYGAI